MRRLVKLSDVFQKYAGVLSIRARMGLEWSVLVSDADKQALPQSFNSHAAADKTVTALNNNGVNASVVWTSPYAKDIKMGYRLYIKPRNDYGHFL